MSGGEVRWREDRAGKARTEYRRPNGRATGAAREPSKYQISARCGMGEDAGRDRRWEFCALRSVQYIEVKGSCIACQKPGCRECMYLLTSHAIAVAKWLC